MTRRKDVRGQRFGMLIVRLIFPHDKVVVDCDCGNTGLVKRQGHLRTLKSCGCQTRAITCDPITKRQTTEYRAWNTLKDRCLNPKNTAYHRYGGRGITVAKEWLGDYRAFLAHVGRKPSPEYSLDRIDNDGNYEPGNVRWADPVTQANNSCHIRKIVVGDIALPITKWASRLGGRRGLVLDRIDKLGWSEEKAVTTPVKEKSK